MTPPPDAQQPAAPFADQSSTHRSAVSGRFDGANQTHLIGWALDTSDLASRCAIQIMEGERVVAQGIANRRRQDLAARGIGDGHFGFCIPIPSALFDGEEHRLHARDAATHASIQGEKEVILPKIVIGKIDGISAGRVFGWVPGDTHTAPEVDIRVGGLLHSTVTAKIDRADVALNANGAKSWGFSFDLGDLLDDEIYCPLEIRHAQSGLHLLGSPIGSKQEERAWGTVDQVAGAEFHGWACTAARTSLPTQLELWVDGAMVEIFAADTVRVDLRRMGLIPNRCGFSHELPTQFWDGAPHQIEIRPKDVEKPLKHGQFVLNVAPLAAPQSERLRTLNLGGDSARARADSPLFQAECESQDPIIDVIIPVYAGLEETLTCLNSVLKTPDTTPHALIAINDGSPDASLTAALRELAAADPRLTLIEHPVNMGFVATVNRGMQLHPGRDVILLNADTVAPANDWIARLRRAAHSSPEIATVTPLSNRATICSFPRCNVDNEMVANHTVDDIDTLFRDNNPSQIVDIPTGVGSCMYIRRRALNDTGYFNEGSWGRGYAEENEFSIRSKALGWRHVAACDTFVQHHGAVSFKAEKSHLVSRNLALLNKTYPEYLPAIEAFLADDPLADARARVVIAILKRRAKRYMLHVQHGWGGGTEVHVNALCQRLEDEGIASLTLRPGANGSFEIRDASDGLCFHIPKASALTTIVDHLRELGVWHIHFHHTIGLPASIWRLPKLCQTPYDITLHDFYLVCPRINLLDHSSKFCGQPPVDACERCVKLAPLQETISPQFDEAGGTVVAWRAMHRTHLTKARRVIAPSRDTAERFERIFPNVPVHVQPHPEASITTQLEILPQSTLELRVAIIGAIGPHKGQELLHQVVQLANEQRLTLRFFVVGFTSNDEAYNELGNIDILGHYEPWELPDLLDIVQCQAALFLSPWPETFSYTLTEAWRAGLVPIVTGLGAQAQRVAAHGAGLTLPETPLPEEVIDALLKLQREGFGPLQIDTRSDTPNLMKGQNFLTNYYGLKPPSDSPIGRTEQANQQA